MKRNILITFIGHIAISLLYYPSMYAISSLMYYIEKPINPEIEINTSSTGIVVWLISTIVFTYLLYVIAGRLFLKPIEEKRSNFISVWMLSIVLIFISFLNAIYGTIDKVADDTQFLFVYMNPIGNSFRFLFYNFPGVHIDPYYIVLFVVFPFSAFLTSACLWIGMMLKMRRIQKRRKINLDVDGEIKTDY